ncbi:MAG: hypothetical protein D6728_04270 [Cyanobacteria bacterium J055]|nr:MAG: hypothetical protein D6728_04270 [Cyanobacteria bacterium J055]
MSLPKLWKTLPAPVRWLIRPWFFVVSAAHGVLLMLPHPPENAREPEITQLEPPPETLIRVAKLPPKPPTPPPTTPPASPPASSPPPQSAAPAPTPALREPAPTLDRPPPDVPSEPPVRDPEATPEPAPAPPNRQVEPTPKPVPEPVSEPVPEPTPEPTPTPKKTLEPTPEPTPDPTPDPTPTPFHDFPHASGAQSGCNGRDDCWQTSETQWRSIASNLSQDLQNRGYEVEQVNIATDTGMRVYRISKTGETPYYLHLVSTLQGTKYVTSQTQMTTEELEELANS